MISNHNVLYWRTDQCIGVIKSYKLTYEPMNVQHAIFDRSRTTNQWTIEPKFLREIADHFSSSAEQLGIHADGDKVIFTSFTTKIAEGKGSILHALSIFSMLTACRNTQTARPHLRRHRQERLRRFPRRRQPPYRHQHQRLQSSHRPCRNCKRAPRSPLHPPMPSLAIGL